VGLGIARTFQELRLISQMSVLEHLLAAFPNQRGERLLDALMRIRVAEVEKQNRAHAATILSMFGLGNKSAEMAGEISYGEQKLLSLACCFATDAQILLLDEPVAGVHPDMALRILGHLQELRQAGRTVVFIEHDLTAVRKVADFVILLDEGKAVAQGPPAQVFERPEILEAYFE
jgi:branched-chain amino acid transport system ATP-binding protein